MDIFETIDNLFEKSPKEAESFMVSALEQAKLNSQDEIALKLYNELLGYYRQTSEKERILSMIDGLLNLLDKMHFEGTIPYATSILNIANAYRSIGELELAKIYYSKTQKIYDEDIESGRLDKNDIRVAGLYNNMSLLYQELSDYETAIELLKKALNIVVEKQEKFEIAVTYANLANTMLLAKDYEASYRYAKEAISRFKARNYIDAHYCAALSAMASCYYEWGNINKAKKIFEEAMTIVENTVGKNSQYERLKESVSMCIANSKYHSNLSGIQICQKYYEEYAKSIIENDFKEYSNHITVGLIGEGSDCYGFDDEYSTDHDFGPGFCIFIDDSIYDEISEKIVEVYENLPKEYMGYMRQETALGQGRRGVIKSSDFYIKHLGASTYEDVDFSQVDDYELAVCTNGQVFYGKDTEFLKMRNALANGYPEKIRLLKLSEDVARFSQTGQYNYQRMAQRDDDFTAQLMIADFCKETMKLYHHYMNQYPPHEKWLKKSTLKLADGEKLIGLLEKVTNMLKLGENIDDIASAIEIVGSFFATKMYGSGEISDIDPYLANHVSELIYKSSIVECEVEELVDKIARLEFKAFDEVKNEGGRASCQDDWPTFYVMRKSQYLTWTKDMLIQYLYDFTREYERGHNLITEKYGRMMESTAPHKYEELKGYFPTLSEQKKAIIEQIVAFQMAMTDEFGKEYPNLSANARSFHSYEDNYFNTSYETYLRGEISTYSDKMLQLYAGFVVECVRNGINIAKETISNTAIIYGYKDIDAFEKGSMD